MCVALLVFRKASLVNGSEECCQRQRRHIYSRVMNNCCCCLWSAQTQRQPATALAVFAGVMCIRVCMSYADDEFVSQLCFRVSQPKCGLERDGVYTATTLAILPVAAGYNDMVCVCVC